MAKRATTLQDILSVDFDTWNSWDDKPLREKTTILISAANKRISAMEKAGEKSPAYRQVMKSGGKFSISGKSFAEVKDEYSRVKTFLEHSTSSVRGWKKTKRDTIKSLKKKIPGLELTESEFNDLFEAYEKLVELDENAESRNLKYDVIKEISERMEDKSVSPDDIANAMKKQMTKLYERNKQYEQDFSNGGVSEYFE